MAPVQGVDGLFMQSSKHNMIFAVVTKQYWETIDTMKERHRRTWMQQTEDPKDDLRMQWKKTYLWSDVTQEEAEDRLRWERLIRGGDL